MRLNRRKKTCYPTFATFKKPPKKNKNIFNWKFLFLGGFFILILSGAVYIAVFSSIFKISDIKVSGNKLISSDQTQNLVKKLIQEKYFGFIPKDTIFVLVENKIKNSLLDEFAEIENVQLKRVQNILEISVKERVPGGILCLAVSQPSILPSASVEPIVPSNTTSTTESMLKPAGTPELPPQNEGCFFIDENGIIYRRAPEISGTLLPTFYSFNKEEFSLRARGVDPEIILFANQAKKELRQAGVDIIGFSLGKEIATDLKAYTLEGWLIYFNTKKSALSQAKILEVLLTDEIKDKRAALQYVDLRVEDRVYYK